ncbi:MAG: SDR family NAD(P)-dependent oxidoreductase, partial [Acidimicrobiaceae bacterium]|nr:SDR family NAD(P)-dependent oxidoreductase [Acidimicrobiaceae bacterium]
VETALITGASSGIGAATARLLASRGTTVGLVGRRASLLEEGLDECRAHAPASRMWVTDLGDLDAAAGVAEEAWEAFGGLDALINNAAVPKVRPMDAITPDDVEHAMRVNFLSPVRMTLAVLPRMLAREHGWIVNVASLGGRLGIFHEAAYSASKFALSGWSEVMAIELHGTGVQVRLIQPGPIDTDIWDRPGEPRAVFADGPKEPPSVVAEGIVAAFDSDRFEHYLPDLKAVVTNKDADIDAYIAGMAAMLETKSP